MLVQSLCIPRLTGCSGLVSEWELCENGSKTVPNSPLVHLQGPSPLQHRPATCMFRVVVAQTGGWYLFRVLGRLFAIIASCPTQILTWETTSRTPPAASESIYIHVSNNFLKASDWLRIGMGICATRNFYTTAVSSPVHRATHPRAPPKCVVIPYCIAPTIRRFGSEMRENFVSQNFGGWKKLNTCVSHDLKLAVGPSCHDKYAHESWAPQVPFKHTYAYSYADQAILLFYKIRHSIVAKSPNLINLLPWRAQILVPACNRQNLFLESATAQSIWYR